MLSPVQAIHPAISRQQRIKQKHMKRHTTNLDMTSAKTIREQLGKYPGLHTSHWPEAFWVRLKE